MLKAICSKKDLSLCSYYGCIHDIIDCEQLEPLKSITHHIHTTRFQHCINVSYYSYALCKKLHLNSRSAARAGLLHDLFYYDRREYNSSRSKGQPSHSRNHSKIALENAEKVTSVSELEKDIIQKHMWPATRPLPKYRETYIITIVDKYCAVLEFFIPTLNGLVHRKNTK